MGESAVPDDVRYWPVTVEKAAQAQREAAERLAETADEYVGWLVRRASQFPLQLARPPLQFEMEYWCLKQGYWLTRSAPLSGRDP